MGDRFRGVITICDTPFVDSVVGSEYDSQALYFNFCSGTVTIVIASARSHNDDLGPFAVLAGITWIIMEAERLKIYSTHTPVEPFFSGSLVAMKSCSRLECITFCPTILASMFGEDTWHVSLCIHASGLSTSRRGKRLLWPMDTLSHLGRSGRQIDGS